MSQFITIVTETSEVVGVEDTQSLEVIEIGNGLSAYQIAVLHGFVGTEAEWLASLQGGGGSETTTTMGALINSATAKATPVDADMFSIRDSVTGLLQKLSWLNLKAAIKTYADTLYQPLAAVLTATTAAFTTALETKLAGIATGATANSSDATLLARANHTGTQAQSTIVNLVSDLADIEGRVNLLDGFDPFFDDFSTTHLGVWDLQKRRTAYTGYAVRAALAADSGATTLDIGFNSDGSFDMAAYSAFGTGSERIVTWYDQSGNGFNLTRAWSATLCPIIRTSSYNGKPCVYFNNGSIGNAGFNDWSGLTDLNIFIAKKQALVYNAYTLANAAASRAIYTQATSDRQTNWGAISSVDSQYYLTANSAGALLRFQFDGDGATNALKGRMFLNTVEETRDAGTGSWPTTYPSGAGFYLNGDSAGANDQEDCEYFCVYYLGQALTAPEVSLINSSINASYFAITDSQIFCVGDSLTLNSANGGPDDADAYPNLLVDSLEAFTDTTWNLRDLDTTSEAGAQTERVLQMMEANGSTLDSIDTHYPNHIVVGWAGTNDLAAADSAATALTGSLNITTPAAARGARVFFLNMLPRQDLGAGNAAFEASRTTYNAGLVATLGATATVVDVAGITELQDPTDTDYYIGDSVHLNDAGNALVAAAVAAAITTEPFTTALKAALAAKAADSAVVHNTGAETVAGVKTFSSSPVVPAPTTDLQAATKKYVDDAVTAGGGYTDENAQDAAAALFTPDDGDVDYTYNDATPSVTSTIKAAAVTLAKMAAVATGTIFYRKTAGSGDPEVQNLATLKTDLGLTGTNSGDQDLSPYFNKSADDTDDITVGTTNKFATAAEKTKLGHISVTQAVDLDDIETRVNNLDAAVVLKGQWDASAGTFPGGGTAQAGASYIVSVGGTVDSVVFAVGDRVIAILDNASTTTFASNWFKADYTDQVLSVNGSTGAVTISTITGNAGTATALQNARTIGGVSFDGTANITVSTATGGFTVSGGNLALGTNSITMSGSIGVTGTRVTKLWAVDGEFTNLPTVGGSTLKSALALVKGDVGLGNVDNTSNATERAAAATLTNKTLTDSTNVVEEITTTASSSTPTPTGGSLRNFFTVTALAAGATFAAPSGTPVNGNYLMIRVKDNATARTLAFNAIYRAIGVTLPTTTVISKTLYIGCRYNSADSKWDVLAVGQEA